MMSHDVAVPCRDEVAEWSSKMADIERETGCEAHGPEDVH
jgi:hypothetical protein